jgi:hypothetical protein
MVILGAKINAELEHQTASDKPLAGPPPPVAEVLKMADTIRRRT